MEKSTSLSVKDCRIIVDGKVCNTNIYTLNGKIVKIGAFRPADTVIHARGAFAIPGVIDPHVHFRMPGNETLETWESGSKAAVSSGITTVLDMPNNYPACTSFEVLQQKKVFTKDSYVNYGFHFGACKDNITTLDRISDIASVKIFMGSSTGNLLIDNDRDLLRIFRKGRIVTVHAEDEELIRSFTRIANLNWICKKIVPSHNDVRPNICAEIACQKVIAMSRFTKTPAYIAHVSTKEEIESIAKARLGKVPVYCEATPHHLFLTAEMCSDNLTKVNPPIRTERDQEALWKGIRDGIVDTIGSDHAPHLLSDKRKDYFNAPSGISGIETSLPLMLNAVNEGFLSLPDVVRLMCTNPARIFGLRNKGGISPGHDADITLIDMNMTKPVVAAEFNSKAKFSPFDGMKLQGWPVCTIVGGKLAWWDGEFYVKNGKEIIYC